MDFSALTLWNTRSAIPQGKPQPQPQPSSADEAISAKAVLLFFQRCGMGRSVSFWPPLLF
jgi:hypothetical protein